MLNLKTDKNNWRRQMATMKAVCISKEKGTAKINVGQAEIIENYGLKGDAHAGNWHRPDRRAGRRHGLPGGRRRRIHQMAQ